MKYLLGVIWSKSTIYHYKPLLSCLEVNLIQNYILHIYTYQKSCSDLSTVILTGPSDSDPMASSHSFLFGLSFLMRDFCSWESLYTSTLIFLGVLPGEVLDESKGDAPREKSHFSLQT